MPGVFDAGLRGGAGAAVVAADEDDVGVGFGDACGDGADADFGDELDGDAGVAVGVFEVVDEFGEIFDGVDVVVRRGRDEADAWGGVPDLGDPGVDLAAGELAAFAGFGALGHFDLDSWALTRYWLVTPKRPEATCLMALLRESPLGSR
jgi:hypothetical protein